MSSRDLCCTNCFADTFLRTFVRKHGIRKDDDPCIWCGSRGARQIAVRELTHLFQRVAQAFLTRYEELPHAKYVEAMDGERLGTALEYELDGVFSEAVEQKRDELAEAIVDADYGTFPASHHSRARPRRTACATYA